MVIKRCDKRAGIIIHKFEDYKHACEVHLDLKVTDEKQHHKVDKSAIYDAKNKLNNLLQEALHNFLITKEEF